MRIHHAAVTDRHDAAIVLVRREADESAESSVRDFEEILQYGKAFLPPWQATEATRFEDHSRRGAGDGGGDRSGRPQGRAPEAASPPPVPEPCPEEQTLQNQRRITVYSWKKGLLLRFY